ncbi:histidinol-phosphate transaminase [Eubacterium oxidoreducens]|uniref:Histidinol-phosphate aminotransferase n=1 Tax=Eubacterium oxidoreducens TaxID=1732 RepID=A0A1G6C0B0_EUBOX|nr:histidinol-phosphate transaminase [Eubacterium oxidoreducens]SDB26339.1 histidinol-phosphate aminotransferase [Eubacterium oxidoreducens]
MSGYERFVRRVVPYTPGEQPQIKDKIKLNTNENPYPPSPKVEQALKQMEMDSMRMYPDPAASDLVEAIADYYHVKPSQVFVGVGSDDVLAMSFLTFFNSDKPIIFPDITYSFYDVWADVFRIPYETKPLTQDFEIDIEDYKTENGGIIFPNPNAPTGAQLPIAGIEEIVAANPDVAVIVDEAYVDFGAESALSLVGKYDNLLVVQTMSKSRSMAGMRIGWAIGNEKMIGYLNDVKYSFNSYTMNRTSIVMGVEAIKDDVYFEQTRKKIIATRERTKEQLRELGFVFPDSKSNFIFASHPKYEAKKLFEALKEKHIFVRYFDKPRIDNYLRITIGTDEEMERLFEFLKNYMR